MPQMLYFKKLSFCSGGNLQEKKNCGKNFADKVIVGKKFCWPKTLSLSFANFGRQSCLR